MHKKHHKTILYVALIVALGAVLIYLKLNPLPSSKQVVDTPTTPEVAILDPASPEPKDTPVVVNSEPETPDPTPKPETPEPVTPTPIPEPEPDTPETEPEQEQEQETPEPEQEQDFSEPEPEPLPEPPEPEPEPEPEPIVPSVYEVELQENILYATANGVDLYADVYMPKGRTDAAPAIIWVHGGGWDSGSRKAAADFAPAFVEHGYAVVAVSYRFTDVDTFPAQVHDVKAAIRTVRAKADDFNIDKDNFAILGTSAGGTLATLAGVTGGDRNTSGDIGGHQGKSDEVQAVINVFGGNDFVNIVSQFTGSQSAYDAGVATYARFLGCSTTEFEEGSCAMQSHASAQTYIDANDPPFLIIHGEQDDLPREQSINLNAALQRAGVSSQLRLVPGYGHDKTIIDDQFETILNFLREVVGE